MNYKKSSLEKKAQPSVSRWTDCVCMCDCVFMCTHVCVMWGEDIRGNGITDLGFPHLAATGKYPKVNFLTFWMDSSCHSFCPEKEMTQKK